MSWLSSEDGEKTTPWLEAALSCGVSKASEESNSKLKKLVLRFRATLGMIRRAHQWLRQHPEGKVIVSVPPLSIFLVGVGLQMRWGRRICWDFRDPVVNRGLQPRPWFIDALVVLLQKVFVPRAQAVFIASPEITRFLPKNCETTVIYSGLAGSAAGDKRMRRDKPVTLLYGGTFYGSRSPLPMLEALRNIVKESASNESPVDLIIFGQWSDLNEKMTAEKLVCSPELSGCVTIKPLATADEYQAALKISDLMWVVTHSSGTDYAIPGKIFDAIELRKPLVVTSHDRSLIAWLINEKIPHLAAPNEQPAIQSLLEQINENFALLEGADWAAIQDKFSSEKQARQILESI